MLLAFVAGALAGQLFLASAPAEAQTPRPRTGPAGQAGDVFAVAGQVTRDGYGLYLVDVRNRTVCLYQYFYGGKSQTLRLMAARMFAYDQQLDEFNTSPSPKEVKQIVAEARRLREAKPKP